MRWTDDEFDEDDALGDDEEWQQDDEFGDLDATTVACPYCQRPVYDDAERCPHCEQYLTAESAPQVKKPWWVLLGVAVCLLIVLLWIFWGW